MQLRARMRLPPWFLPLIKSAGNEAWFKELLKWSFEIHPDGYPVQHRRYGHAWGEMTAEEREQVQCSRGSVFRGPVEGRVARSLAGREEGGSGPQSAQANPRAAEVSRAVAIIDTVQPQLG